MVVGTLKIQFFLAENGSLKGKRKVVRSMVDRVKSKFNVSVAEVGANDKWQTIELGISAVGNDHRFIDSSLSHVLGFLEAMGVAEVVDTQMEIFHL